MALSAPNPFASWHSFFMNLAVGVFVGGVAAEIILTLEYGYTIYNGKKILLSSLDPPGVVFTAIRDYVVGAITAERGASGNIHFGTGPTYLGFIASSYWLLRGCPPLYVHSKSAVTDMSDGPASTETAEKSEVDKRRSELDDPDDSVATSDRMSEGPSADDYAIELRLFEAGDLDQSLWAKHLVEAEGDVEKAKWKYIKDRVASAPTRRSAAVVKSQVPQKVDEHSHWEIAEETPEQRKERERQERLISQSIAKGKPSYYIQNPHMLHTRSNNDRNTLAGIIACAAVLGGIFYLAANQSNESAGQRSGEVQATPQPEDDWSSSWMGSPIDQTDDD